MTSDGLLTSWDQYVLENETGEWVLYVHLNRSETHILYSSVPAEAGTELQMSEFTNDALV